MALADTSIMAYDSVVETIPLREQRVIDSLEKDGPATREELSERLGMRIQTVCPTVYHLRNQQTVKHTGQLRPTRSGRMAHVVGLA